MAENENGTDRSEEATPERLRKSKEKGQVARSKELATASVLISAALSFLVFGDRLAYELSVMMKRAFTFERAAIFDPEYMWLHFSGSFTGLAVPIFTILFMLFVISILGSSLLGGTTSRPNKSSIETSEISSIFTSPLAMADKPGKVRT